MQQMVLLSVASPNTPVEQRLFYSVLMPWLVPSDETPSSLEGNPVAAPPKAFQLSQDLLGRLVSGNAPATEDHLALMRQHNLYFDLPGRGLPLTDEQCIRAIFVQPSRQDNQWLVVCILTSGRSNAITGRYEWIVDGVTEKIVSSEIGASIESDLPSDAINTVVMRVVKLALLYAITHEDETPDLLPRVSDDALQKLPPKKRKARVKTHTLFSVHHLKPTRSSSLPSEGQGSTWKLGHVVEVRGHFRWQRYGKGNLKRKLIFVDEYTKGSGAKKQDMTKL